MRALFLGTPAFAVPSLEALISAGVDVAAVVTQPDRARGRSRSQRLAPPVKEAATAHGIPVMQPDRPRGEDFLDAIRGVGADIAIVVAYGHILRPDLLGIPPLGFVNVHASLLPRWRGAAPIHWAIKAGDAETGVSIMRIEEGLDTGAVWHVARTPIGETDTTGVLFERLATLGARALLDALPMIARGDAPTPQPEAGVTHAPPVERELARVEWNRAAATVSAGIRAMDPAPGAWTTLGGEVVKLFGAEVLRDLVVADEPGVIDVGSPGPLLVSTADGAVAIRELQSAGRRRLVASEWLRGSGLEPGARFE